MAASSMASVAGRRLSVRLLCRTTTNSCPRRPSFVGSLPNTSSTPIRTHIANSSPLRLLRRELSSFKPVHSAIASAYLVSKLPCDASTPNEGLSVAAFLSFHCGSYPLVGNSNRTKLVKFFLFWLVLAVLGHVHDDN